MSVGAVTCPPTVSYGGGAQSTAMLVMAARGEIDYRTFLFANTGADSENPATLAYVSDVAMPFATTNGIAVHEVVKTYADGRRHPTLYEYMTRDESRSVPIPVRLSGGKPASRTCTVKWKKDALSKWRVDHGATAERPAKVAIGFSWDESERASNGAAQPFEVIEYPLIDRRLRRSDCEKIITDAGLPLPEKSACWFCPWHSIESWRVMHRTNRELFDKAVDLERLLSERTSSERWSKPGPCFMSDTMRPLDEMFDGTQLAWFDEGPQTCDTGGGCWT